MRNMSTKFFSPALFWLPGLATILGSGTANKLACYVSGSFFTHLKTLGEKNKKQTKKTEIVLSANFA